MKARVPNATDRAFTKSHATTIMSTVGANALSKVSDL
jgi:hypothetical protein